MKSKFPGAVPEIPVSDINKAVAYYKDNMGFKLDWGGEELGLAGISRENCRMFLANPDYREQYGNVGPVLIWLNLNSKEEVDDLYRLWNSSNVSMVSDPESKPWGLHEFTAADVGVCRRSAGLVIQRISGGPWTDWISLSEFVAHSILEPK